MATIKKTKRAQLGYSIGTYTTKDKDGYTQLDRFKNEKGEDRYYRSTDSDLYKLGKMNKFKALMNRPDSVISSTLTPREREVMKSQEPNMKKGGKMTKIKKAQTGKNVPKGMIESEMFPGKMIPKSKSNYETGKIAKMVEAGKKAKSYEADKKAKLNEAAKKSAIQSSKEISKSPAKAKDGKWIQKAVNPKHKGYCTPMTKATCTPKRKALAMTFKKMAKARKGK